MNISHWAILDFLGNLSTRRVTPLTRVFNILELLQITPDLLVVKFSNMGNPHTLIPPDYQI